MNAKVWTTEKGVYVAWGDCAEVPLPKLKSKCNYFEAPSGYVTLPLDSAFVLELDRDGVGIQYVLIAGTRGRESGDHGNPWVILVEAENQTVIHASRQKDVSEQLIFQVMGEWEEPGFEAFIKLLHAAFLLKRKEDLKKVVEYLNEVAELAAECGTYAEVVLHTGDEVWTIRKGIEWRECEEEDA